MLPLGPRVVAVQVTVRNSMLTLKVMTHVIGPTVTIVVNCRKVIRIFIMVSMTIDRIVYSPPYL